MTGLYERSQALSAPDDDARAASAEAAYCELLRSGVTTLVDVSPPWSGWVELFAQSGLTPFEVLQTATTRAADALGESANLGSVETGKLADIIIVSGDPLADIRNARKVRTVIKNGEVHTVEALLKRPAR